MPTDKALTLRASAIPRRRSFGYTNSNKNLPLADGSANELCPEHQALILDFRR